MNDQRIFYKTLCHRRGSYKRGFTLIEIILATALTVLGVVAVVSVMSSGVFANNSVDGQLTALYLAQDGMEAYIKSTPYASITNTALTGVSGFGNYNREIVVAGNPASDAKIQVTVNVYWAHAWMRATETLTTLLAQPS